MHSHRELDLLVGRYGKAQPECMYVLQVTMYGNIVRCPTQLIFAGCAVMSYIAICPRVQPNPNHQLSISHQAEPS